jgi:hypothetical protein
MALRVADPVLSLPVVLVIWWVDDLGARLPYPFVMSVDVAHLDDDPAPG